tara:strand:- start:9244 stop:9765 length:522 start_codon:yes stop_codon:yes gene_type:complete
MCPPAAVLAVSAGLQAAGSLFSGIAESRQLKRSAAIDEANAQTAIQNSINLRNAGAVNAGRQNRIGRRAGSKIRTAGAKGNVVVDLNNNLDAQIENTMNSMLNELDEKYKAEIQARNQLVEARNFRQSASNKRSAASSSIIGGVLGAAGSAAKGIYTGQQAGFINTSYGSSLL